MPEITLDAGDYLMRALADLGPVRGTGMGGLRAADWPEIAAFAQATGAVVEAWEMVALRQMAAAYVAGLRDGADPLSIAPADRQDGNRAEQ